MAVNCNRHQKTIFVKSIESSYRNHKSALKTVYVPLFRSAYFLWLGKPEKVVQLLTVNREQKKILGIQKSCFGKKILHGSNHLAVANNPGRDDNAQVFAGCSVGSKDRKNITA